MRNIIALAALAAAVLSAATSHKRKPSTSATERSKCGTPSWRRLTSTTARPWIPKVWRALKP